MHLARRVPAPRRPQRPQPATVRRAVWRWLPGQGVVFECGEGRGERKSRVSEVAVQTGPQTVQTPCTVQKFARRCDR